MEFETAKNKAEALVNMYQKLIDTNLIDNTLTAKDYAIKNIEEAQELTRNLGDENGVEDWESIKLETILL